MRDAVASGLAVVVLAGLLGIGHVWEWMVRHNDHQADEDHRRRCERARRRWPPT